MDEPGWTWPYWKFGMKKEDFTTKLHDQYNTFPSSIQDPEAFHHDVFEISCEASSADEFHRLMAARKQQRLQELHKSLESAAFEIIGHPKLIGTEQWQYALQLFRTRSLDSLVRYFSSYLPDNYLQRHAHGIQTPPSAGSSFTDCSSVNTSSTNPSSVDNVDSGDVLVPTFMTFEDEASFTREPENLHGPTTISRDTKIPHSFRSTSTESDTTPSSPINDNRPCDFALQPPTPPRTLSFSGSESGSIPALSGSLTDDETSQSEEGDSPAASEPDLSESRSSLDSIGFSGSENGRRHAKTEYYEEEDDIPAAQLPVDSFFDEDFETVQVPSDYCEPIESETPTPRQETVSSCYRASKSVLPCRVRSLHRASSPKSTRHRRREGSPPQCVRRSPEELFSRVQKVLPDPTRTRPKGRRRLE